MGYGLPYGHLLNNSMEWVILMRRAEEFLISDKNHQKDENKRNIFIRNCVTICFYYKKGFYIYTLLGKGKIK